MLPALVIAFITFLIPYYTNITGIIMTLLFIISLALFIASITIVISVINDTVVSAQTAYLPVFLILVAVCVTCIQNYNSASDIYLCMPIYGQFYGIGNAILGSCDLPKALCCIAVTLLLTLATLRFSEHLLLEERFTISIDTVTEQEIKRSRFNNKPTILERMNKTFERASFLIDQLFYPLIVLSIYQMLAVIPVVITYMRRAEYSQFILELKDVGSVSDIMNKAFEIIGIFMGNPLFLGLMAIGYALIIITYALRAKLNNKTHSLRRAFDYLSLPLNSPLSALRKYLLGLLIGITMMGSVYLILIATKQITLTGFGVSPSLIGTFIVNLLMWIPQGASEEVMFRGYMIPRISSKYNKTLAVFMSSLLFALFHSLNVGFTVLSAVNLFLIALLFALIYERTGNIWMTCAIHTIWNLAQGNIFGLQVSGTMSGTSLLHTSYQDGALSYVTGGSFGPEGGLAVTAVTVIALVIVILLSRKSGVNASDSSRDINSRS